MKKLIPTLLLGAAISHAQITTPPVYFGGPIGPAGAYATWNSGNLILSADANHTMVYPEMSAVTIKVTSTVSLTATRNLVAPTGYFTFFVKNATTGGQSIQVIGSSGSGCTIPNGTGLWVMGDGTNYICGSSSGGGSMPWPALAGIPNYSGSSSWGTSYSGSNPIPGNFLAPFVASGASHAPGAVPDPGATAGTTHYLREDGTWFVPPGGSATPGGSNTQVQFNNSGAFGAASLFTYNNGTLASPRLNAVDQTGNCAGISLCNTMSAQYGSRVSTTGSEDNAGLYMAPLFAGPGRATGPIGGVQGWTVTHGQDILNNFEVIGIAQGRTVQNNFYKSGSDSAAVYSYDRFEPGCGNTLNDEGCTAETEHMLNLGEASGTLTGGTNTAPTFNPGGTVPDGGYLMDTSATANITTAFNGTASSNATYNEWSIPVTASSIPVSTGVCLLTSAIPDSGLPRTSQVSSTGTYTCPFGSLTTGYATIVPNNTAVGPPETILITAASGGSVTFNHSLVHGVGSVIAQGGVAERVISVATDNTDFGYHSTYLAIGSVDGTNLLYCVYQHGGCNMQLPRTGETPETTSSAITLVPAAQITSNVTGGGLTVEPNPWYATANVNFGDSIFAAPQFYAAGVGHWWTEQVNLPCNQALGGCSGFRFDYGGAIASGAFNPVMFTNTNPASNYAGYGGWMSLPNFNLQLAGPAYHQLTLNPGYSHGSTFRVIDNLTGCDYDNLLDFNTTGDALFDEFNGTGSTCNGIVAGQPRFDIASPNVNMGSAGSNGVTGAATAPFRLAYGDQTMHLGYQTVINTGAGSPGVAALDVTTTGAPSGVPSDVLHIHANSTGKSIFDTPVQLTGLGTTGTCAFYLGIDSSNNIFKTNSGCTGGGSGPTIQTNGTNNTSQTTLNFVNPASFNGLSFTYSNPTAGNQTFAVSGNLNLAGLSTQAADTLVMNASGSTASPNAVALTSCSSASSALTYNTTTHAWGCNTISGSGTVSGQTTGYIPLASSATALTAPSNIDDGVTTAGTLTAHEPIAITGSSHGLSISAGTAVAGAAGKVIYAVDATSGFAEVNENNTGLSRVCTAANGICSGGGVADTTTTVGTTAVAANSCSTTVTVTMTGLTTSMTASFTPTTDVSAVTGWGPVTPGLYISAWPSAGTLNYKVCNSSAASITPGASVTFNISAR